MEDMTQIREPQRGLTFEDVWAAMMETDRRMKETALQMKETDRKMKEMAEETTQKMKETARQMKETDRKIGELGTHFGKLGNRFGELVEHLVSPNITEKFKALNYTFENAIPDYVFFSRNGTFLAEVDVWLENDELTLALEIKAKLRTDHVDDHLKRMEVLRAYLDERDDSRKLLGAMAGAIVPAEVRTYVLRNGFYLIEQSGDTVKIEPPADFKPRIW